MSYQILSRKYRPQTFAEVVGQGHVTRTLSNAIASNRLAQAYLFSGPRGVGKTTTARIIAKALNCMAFPAPTPTPCGACDSCRDVTAGASMDVLEIDGASNTGVDNIRDLREQVKYVPLQSRYKVYIIDEVHMLSNAAFNALLKTLEEPPPHLLFIFATTEAQKILPTILSRCQHFHFKRVGRLEMIAQINQIAAKEGITIGERALSLVAKASEGSGRDALSLVDQVVAYGGAEVREEDVVAILGVVDREGFATLTRAIRDKDAAGAIAAVRALLDHGHDVKLLCADLVEYVRRGVDMMDCVLPTRNARNGYLFTSTGSLHIRNAVYARDARPLDERCGCAVCRRYSRAYLRHLFNAGEISAAILATHHNLYFYLDLMRRIRTAIREGTLDELANQVKMGEAAE